MLALLVAGLLAAATPSAVPTSSSQVAVIVTTRSTNTPGYRIALSPDGGAEVTRQGGLSTRVQVDLSLTKRFYADLARAGALDALPVGHCMKSASFGTATWINYRGANSPDLQCAQNDIERVLEFDARAIAGAVFAP
jgi:hypothetical protein